MDINDIFNKSFKEEKEILKANVDVRTIVQHCDKVNPTKEHMV